MSDLPPSASHASSSDCPPEELLRRGLTTLKQANYGAAIECFSRVAQDTTVPSSLRVKAEMGWLQALQGSGQILEAQARCQALTQHPAAKVQRWARQRLLQLTSTVTTAAAPDRSGFRPLEATPPPVSAAADGTGTLDAQLPGSLFHYETLNEILDQRHASPEVVPAAAPAAATAVPPVDPPAQVWQQHSPERLSHLRSLPPSQWLSLKGWGLQVVSAIALFWLCREGLQWTFWQVARGLMALRWLVYIPVGWRHQDHTSLTLVLLGGLLLASPWLLDWLLRRAYGQTPLSLNTLKQTHPEGCRLLRRLAQQRGWLVPSLRQLPTQAPILFSYGWWPRYSRIVVSQGLLQQLDDDEFATLMGYELTRLTRWTLPYWSLVATLLQGLHQGYWQLARWGDRCAGPLQFLVALLSAGCYGGYWLVRKLHFPLSRAQVLACDRQAVEWTGNPNALVRSLLKLQQGLANSLRQERQTLPLVESTDLLAPISYEMALGLGSLDPDATLPQVLRWDLQNPYRYWLAINSSHPLLGDRLKRLTGYALSWQLAPELPPFQSATRVKARRQDSFWRYWLPFLLQISPYAGPLIGAAIALVLWFVGGLVEPLGAWRLGWLYGDESVLQASLLLGVGIGIMVRINTYFPDITAANCWQNPALPSLLKNPMALPTDSRPVRLQGTLLGRPGVANWLCQDFILETSQGLVKLHFLSILGGVSNLFLQPRHPSRWVGRSLVVQGWFRRGAIAWIDIDMLIQTGQPVTRANHPMFSVLLSLGTCALGVYLLFRG